MSVTLNLYWLIASMKKGYYSIYLKEMLNAFEDLSVNC